MEKLNHLPFIKFNGDVAQLRTLELIVGDIIEMAEISVTAEAWVRGFERENKKYKFLFQTPISQHGSSRNKPKKFPVYVFGVLDDGKTNSLVYAQSKDDETNEVNTLRLTSLAEITKYRGLTYQD